MNFKLFAPLTAIAVLVASCSGDDNASKKGIGTVSPEFVVDYSISNSRTESRADEQASVAPDITAFSFRLMRDDGKFDKTYTSLSGFISEQFPVGAYTLEATYGDFEKEGIDKAYYYGSAAFNIYDGETAEPALVARLANTAVSVEYTEAFKNYFTAYSSTLHSSNSSAYIDMAADEAGWAYLKPGDITLSMNLTKQNGTSFTFEPAKITGAVAGTHYHITVDVNGGEVGNETISISFDATTETEPVIVDVSDAVINAPAPVVTPTGFTSGTAIDIIEGDAAEAPVKASLLAMAGLSEVRLSTSSPTPALAAIQGDIDLLTATVEQKAALEAAGITCKGLWQNPDQLAVIDFSNMFQNLRVANGVSTHTFSLVVKDKYGKVSDPVVLTINAPAPILNISNPDKFTYGQTTATFDFDYNGQDIQNKVTFQATNSMAALTECTYAGAPTVIADNKYRVTINVPLTSGNIKVQAKYNNSTSNLFEIKREVDVVIEEANIWATQVTARLAPASEAGHVTGITINGAARTETFDANTGLATFTGLTAGTTYEMVVSRSNGDAVTKTFTTEAAAAVPNGDFETLTQTINIQDIQQGGQWTSGLQWLKYSYTDYNISEPTGWASVNAKTACTGASNQNTWFVCPSTFSTTSSQNGAAAMSIRNVGWDLNGTTPSLSTNGTNTYYSKNAASVANRAAGKLFLGSYSFDASSSKETYTEGVSFTSRPSSLKGYYKYTRDGNDGAETGVAKVEILNGTTVIGTGSIDFGPANDFTAFTVDITYSNKALKATQLRIMFSSSNHMGDIATETATIKTTNYMSESEQCTRGAQLTVDNLTFTY